MRELLSERGYAATSPKMILERAKLGQGSLYYDFTGKQDLAVATIQALMDRSLRLVNNELEGVEDDSYTSPLVDGAQRPGTSEGFTHPASTTTSKTEAALSKLFEYKEGRALARLLADPVATEPGPLADAITVWVKALRMLLTEALTTEGHRGDGQAKDTQQSTKRGATRGAEAILVGALGQTLLQIGTTTHLPR